MLARQVEGGRQGTTLLSRQSGIEFAEQCAARAEQLLERLEHQRILALEVGIEAADGEPRRAHHFPDARFDGAPLEQGLGGGTEDAGTGLGFLVAHDDLRKYYG